MFRSALSEPALPGAPELEAVRHRLMAAVKAEPLLFLRPPEYRASDDPAVLAYRRWLARTQHPAAVLSQLAPRLSTKRHLLREVVLRDGYLYADTEPLARALVETLHAEDLFDEASFWVQRGERLIRAERDGRRYVYAEGAQAGQAVALVLFDRVGLGAVPPAVGLDVRALREREGFHRMRVQHLGERHVIASLFYDAYPVQTVLGRKGARLDIACKLPSAMQEPLASTRTDTLELAQRFRAVQRAIGEQIADGLPFDEPRREVGQEDGKLRTNWIWAYESGRETYRFHNVKYPIFDARGRPQIPEVCVDFLLDTFERTAGTWWHPRGQARGRTIGRIDFDVYGREGLRRASLNFSILRAASRTGSTFSTWLPPSRSVSATLPSP